MTCICIYIHHVKEAADLELAAVCCACAVVNNNELWTVSNYGTSLTLGVVCMMS